MRVSKLIQLPKFTFFLVAFIAKNYVFAVLLSWYLLFFVGDMLFFGLCIK